LSDESKTSAQGVAWLFFPRTEAELAEVVNEMALRGIPITISGSRTGLVGGCVPYSGALISMERFDQIERIYFDEKSNEWRVCLQANVSLKTLQEALKFKRFSKIENSQVPSRLNELEQFKADSNSYFYPPDPTEMSASIGGTVATNASGARTFRFGPTRIGSEAFASCS
jgi:D-lactate dehydrogenase (cytochrome)